MAASPSSHAPPSLPPAEASRPVRRPLAADPAGPLLQQRRTALQHHQVRQRDMRPDLDRLPGPLGQQVRRHEPPHGLLQAIVAPLGLRPGVLRPGRSRQRIQHRRDDRRALRGEVAGQDPGAVEGGLQLDRAVLELIVLTAGVLGQRPGVDLRDQTGQIPQVPARPRRPQQNLIRRRTAIRRQLVGPAADRPRERLRHLPRGQRRRDLRMRRRPPHPRGVRHRGALGDPGPVDQPRPRAVIRIRAVPLPGGERRQDPGPRRGAHRVDLLQRLQALRLGLGRHRGGVGGGQVAHRGLQHAQRLGGARGRRNGAHLAHLLGHLADRRTDGLLSPGHPGGARLFDFLFYISSGQRHLPGDQGVSRG